MQNALKFVEVLSHGCSPEQVLLPLAGVLFSLLVVCYLVRSCFALRARKWRARLAAEVSSRETAEAANQIKADFLAYMSHQIRIPFIAIIEFTELALDSPLNPELRDYLGTVRTSADWLNHVANDVLEFARIEAGSLKLEQADFSLADCIRSTVNIVRAEADARHLALKYRIDEKIPAQLRGDAGRLRQILFNLVENAVKSTISGSVILTAQAGAVSSNSVRVQFNVADTGIGMSEERQKDIFEPLVQGPSVDRKWKSSAFGLGISQRLVGMMGGAIEAQSLLGAGTTVQFDVCFDVVATPLVAPHSPQAGDTARAHGLSVLVAEDARILAKALLDANRHTVIEAGDGQQVLPLFAQRPVDLVLMDIDLPHINGLETTRKIRATERPGSHALIYALTANTSSADRNSLRAAGLDGFLAKPVDIDSFLNIVAAVDSFRPAEGAVAVREQPLHPVGMEGSSNSPLPAAWSPPIPAP
jgi:signal transduction histidine kinase/ActR/RegA family two-component response regulator